MKTRVHALKVLVVLAAIGVLVVPSICRAQEPDSLVVADLDFDPDSVNLKSNGRWVTCYIELPAGHEPDSVDVSSVVLCDSLYAVEHPVAVADHDGDEVDELMVKFVRADVQAMLAPGDSVEVWVTGDMPGGSFYGADTIRVFWPGDGQGDDQMDPEVFRDRLKLHQNCPNPFNPQTTIGFSIPEASHVTLDVYDTAGRLVATLVDREVDSGEHTVEWGGLSSEGLPVASGVYFYTVTARGFSETRKFLVLK